MAFGASRCSNLWRSLPCAVRTRPVADRARTSRLCPRPTGPVNVRLRSWRRCQTFSLAPPDVRRGAIGPRSLLPFTGSGATFYRVPNCIVSFGHILDTEIVDQSPQAGNTRRSSSARRCVLFGTQRRAFAPFERSLACRTTHRPGTSRNASCCIFPVSSHWMRLNIRPATSDLRSRRPDFRISP